MNKQVKKLLSLLLVIFACMVLARRKGRVSPTVRLLPVYSCLLLGAALALDAGWLCLIPALMTAGFAGAIYISNEPLREP